MIPLACRANTILPVLYWFEPQLLPDALILAAVIILADFVVLWIWMRVRPFRMHLGISTLINILSSLAGSVLVLVTINLEFWVVPLMLALTVVIEAPMLKFFYRRQSLGWGKAWLISLVMNVIS